MESNQVIFQCHNSSTIGLMYRLIGGEDKSTDRNKLSEKERTYHKWG